MSNDMRIVKFKMMIRDIWEDSGKISLTNCLGQLNGGWYTALLAIIYDYDKLNDYGKVIMDQVCELDKNEFYDEGFSHRVKFVEKCKDMEYRMKAAKTFVMEANKDSYRVKDKMFFIFWALMILAVDDTDKEEYLSLICDFAKMMKISDKEMMDIVQIIQAAYQMKGDFNIQTREVNLWFKEILHRFGVKVATSAMDESERLVASLFGGFLKQ